MSFRSSRGVLTAALSLVTLAASPAVASAEVESPVQGESSNGLFLSYAPKSDDEGAVCFVDSGIDENPDTEDGIIERTSVAGDGSSGEDVDKVILLALGGSDSPSGRGGGGGSSGGSGGGGSGGGGSSSEGPSAGPPALTPALFAVSSARLSRGRLLVAGRPAQCASRSTTATAAARGVWCAFLTRWPAAWCDDPPADRATRRPTPLGARERRAGREARDRAGARSQSSRLRLRQVLTGDNGVTSPLESWQRSEHVRG